MGNGRSMSKLFYKPLGIILGVLAGRLAGKLFKQFWELAARESSSPSAMDRDRGWGEIVAAAVIRGAVFSGVRAVVDRRRRNRLRTRNRVMARQDLDEEWLGAQLAATGGGRRLIAPAMRMAAPHFQPSAPGDRLFRRTRRAARDPADA